MKPYMRHLIGPYGPKGVKATLSRETLEKIAEEKRLFEDLRAELRRLELEAIRTGQWTRFNREVTWARLTSMLSLQDLASGRFTHVPKTLGS